MRRHERVAGVEAQLAAHRPERLPPAIRVEADDVATEQAPRGSRSTISSGSTDQPSGPTHGMCVKCAITASRQPLAHELRRQVQVVVVEEDGRARVAVQLLDDRVGECLD